MKMDALFEAARQASQNAYCPYSRFRVGAAILGRSGTIYRGCNVENASYGLTICAERGALMQMVASGEQSFQRIVIYTPTATPTAPCGACRQMLYEFAPDAEVISICDGEDVLRAKVAELLPHGFGPHNLTST